MRMRRRLLLVVALMGCSGVAEPPEPAAQEGVVVERDRPIPIDRERPTIWVKDEVADECGVVYVIFQDTELFARDARGQRYAIGVEDLAVGASVRVWTDVVLSSCPGQAGAERVELVSGPESSGA